MCRIATANFLIQNSDYIESVFRRYTEYKMYRQILYLLEAVKNEAQERQLLQDQGGESKELREDRQDSIPW